MIAWIWIRSERSENHRAETKHINAVAANAAAAAAELNVMLSGSKTHRVRKENDITRITINNRQVYFSQNYILQSSALSVVVNLLPLCFLDFSVSSLRLPRSLAISVFSHFSNLISSLSTLFRSSLFFVCSFRLHCLFHLSRIVTVRWPY